MRINTIVIIAVVILVGGTFVLTRGNNDPNIESKQDQSNIAIVGGEQIIEINAKGGYSPKVTTAKANIPTIVKIRTQGTFDCSSAFTIPALGYHTNLPSSGITEIEVPPQKAGTKLQGLCSMGMYSFIINFN
ncbi:MAG: cupredoxin domain-containing protein [Candidatus Colwellbacteria bacterium]|nr:cupredoxin domain-containing protein [Candidatus Colwellbacteria bacterium]